MIKVYNDNKNIKYLKIIHNNYLYYEIYKIQINTIQWLIPVMF